MWWRALLLFLSLALLTPQGLHAQVSTIPVRGGEHDAYTRLVIQIPEDNTWRVTSEGPFAHIILSGPPVIFDLSQTFARIPRTRLRDLTQVQDGLQLSLACPCDIRASEDIPQFLVIDIIGRAGAPGLAPAATPRPRNRSLAQLPDAAIRATAARRAGRDLARALRDAQTAAPQEGPASTGALTLAQFFPMQRPNAAHLPLQAAQEALSPEAQTPRAAMIEELAQTLSRHVSAGVLESTSAFRRPGDPDGDIAQPALPERADAMAHFQVTDALQEQGTMQGRDSTCPDPALLEIAAQADDAGPGTMAELLRPVHTEFDNIDPPSVITLAQHFVAMGFGAETRLVLSMLDTPDRGSAILREISFLLDLSSPETPDRLLELADCGKMGALWAFLAQAEDATPTPAQPDLLVQAVGALPAHLRLHLGPVIVKRLVAQQLLEHARMIRDALDRVAQTPTPDLTLARTSLALAAAPAELAPEIEAGLSPEHSDETLIFLMERRLREDAPVARDLIALAQARLPALRRSPDGQDLARLLVLAWARNKNFAAAFDLLTGRDARIDPPLHDTLRATVLSALAVDAEDPDFVTLVFAQTPWDDITLPNATRQALAQRLRSLGFAQQAALLEASPPDTAPDPRALQTADGARPPSPADAAGLAPEPGSAGTDGGNAAARVGDARQDDDAMRARAAVAALRLETLDNAPGPSLAAPMPVVRQDDGQDNSQDAGQNDGQNAGLSVLQSLPDPRLLAEEAPLARGRTALEESAALRARLEAMLAGDGQD